MALKKKIDFHGIDVPNAYIRVGRFVFTGKTDCRAYVSVFADKAAAEAGREPLKQSVLDFQYDPEGLGSLYAQAYAAAKALGSEFAGSEDI